MSESRDPRPQAAPTSEEELPVFGSWRRIYAAVIVSNLLVMALVALFSSWPF